MTTKQFLIEVAMLWVEWEFDIEPSNGYKSIRTKDSACLCPVLAVIRKRTGETQGNNVASVAGPRVLKMSSKQTWDVMTAADGTVGKWDDPMRYKRYCGLRKVLLVACGLEEKADA